MSKQKLTPWFPPEVKPVRNGWYHTDHLELGPDYPAMDNRWWNGKKWLSAPGGWVVAYQNRHWRGLTEKST
jgi:hypothetical protein